ncbi:MAG: RNA methyltransferase [Candidatus Falkowbacteria bacterium]|nr:RNA methyltransferase [Candidatus Falkowbacteria bacterium]
MTPEREQKLKQVIQNRQQGVVVLEDIHDPHNAAAILRSCDAFGIQKICFIFEKEKRFNPRRIGHLSSASASKWLDMEFFTSTIKCLSTLKRRGYYIIATALDEKAKDFRKADLTRPKTVLMFGNEYRGLSIKAQKLAHETVYIAMKGLVQSLNLSVTAAVCLAELDRQRAQKKAKNRYFLTKLEQGRLLKKWSA